MTLLDKHLEQISQSATAIADLAFPPPKIFTNALLHSHDITTLIRDTEAHENALFTTAPPNAPRADAPRRSTFHAKKSSASNGIGVLRHPRHDSAVATLLGNRFGEEIAKERLGNGREKGEVDVEILLAGAERLCDIYPISGAAEKISSLRTRFEKLSTSISRFESRVSKQTTELARLNRPRDDDLEGVEQSEEDTEDNFDVEDNALTRAASQGPLVTQAELRREEEEIKELEKKKRSLEDWINDMDTDLGGLQNRLSKGPLLEHVED